MRERLVTFQTWHQDVVRTEDSVFTTLATIAIPTGKVVSIHAVVTARCPYLEEGLFAESNAVFQLLGGLATDIGVPVTLFFIADDPTWAIQWSTVGADVLIQVSGDPYTETMWMVRWIVTEIDEV